MKPKLQIIATGDFYVADPPSDELLRLAFLELDIARGAAAQAESEVKRLVRAYAGERGLSFMRVEAARREIFDQ